MSDEFLKTILALVKARKNRLKEDTTLDDVFTMCIKGAFSKLADKGIHIDETDSADTLMLVDYAVWRYNNRDSQDAEPLWLKTDLRERWLREPFRETPGGGGA